MFSVFVSFFASIFVWLFFFMGLLFLSKSSRPESVKKHQIPMAQGERAFHSPLLIIVVGLMSYLIFPIFLMLIESNAKDNSVSEIASGFTHFEGPLSLLFFVSIGISFFYYAREQGAEK